MDSKEFEYDDYLKAKYKRKKSRAYKSEAHDAFHDGKHLKKMKNYEKVQEDYSDDV